MFRDERLQLLHLCLHGRVSRVFRLHMAERRDQGYQRSGVFLLGLCCLMGVLCLVLLVGRRCAPLLFGLCGVLVELLRVKCGKIHGISSCLSDVFRESDEAFQMPFLEGQQLDLLFQRLFSVEVRVLQDHGDLF